MRVAVKVNPRIGLLIITSYKAPCNVIRILFKKLLKEK